MDFNTLLKVAPLKPEYFRFACSVYRQKFSRLTFVFGNNNILINRAVSEIPMEFSNVTDKSLDDDAIDRINRQLTDYIGMAGIVTKTEIQPRNYNFLLNIYKYFGYYIKKLIINTNCRSVPVHSELIARLISAYNAESLVDIEFDFGADRILEQLTTPLFNVESVTFRGDKKGLSNRGEKMSLNVRNISLNDMFPSLRRLHLEYMIETDYDIFDYNIPNLQHVSLIKSHGLAYLHIRLPEVILKNPQIKSIALKHANDAFVRNINWCLPQLETLTLSYLMVDPSFHIEFGNVTSFGVIRTTDETRYLPYHAYGHGNIPLNLHFPKLQTVYIEYVVERSQQWITFLSEHNNVKELHLKVVRIEYQELQELTANLAKLEKVSLEYYDCFPRMQTLASDSIVQFLTIHDNVKEFNVINCLKQYYELQLKLELQNWDAIKIDGGMSFQRQKNTQL